MTYLTHTVRRIREDPIEGEPVGLIVTASDDADRDAVEDALSEIGEIDRRLEFGAVAVTVPQERVDEVCDLDGIDRVETDNTLEMDPTGAGEDVE